MNYGEAREVKHHFEQEYELFSGRRIRYVVSSSLMPLAWAMGFLYGSRGDAKSSAEIDRELIEAGKDPNELCILVGVLEELPEELALPGEHQGIEVVVFVSGEIVAA
jgi:hypothetical protein